LSAIGLFVSGMVVGSAVYMGMHQTNFSVLVERNTVLQNENANLLKELQNIKKFRTSESIIKKITVHLDTGSLSVPLDPVAEQELKRQVQRKLERIYEGADIALFASGTEQERLAELRKLQEIVSDQYTVKEHLYRAEATSVAVVQTELIVYVKPKLSPAAAPSAR
jgi:hypothetical protein